MIKCMIFDLDGTLINTSALEALRHEGRWREVESSLYNCSPYLPAIDVLNTARSAGLKICVVTNSPSHYAKQVLKYFDISVDYLVGYHDVRNHKPNPEGIEKVLSHFRIEAADAIYLGDSIVDLQAARTANVTYFAVDWCDPTVIDEKHFGISKLLEFIGSNLPNTGSPLQRSKLVQSGNHFYLGYYLEGIKQEIWAFKDGKKSAVKRWTEKTRELAGFLPQSNYIVRALGHAETQKTNHHTALDEIAEILASSMGAVYSPNCLKKDRVLIKSTQCSAQERNEQVNGAYSVDLSVIRPTTINQLTFLIVDDVFTTGATSKEITRALSKAYPTAKIYVFSLVKTLYRLDAPGGSAESNHNSQLFFDLYNPAITLTKTFEKSAVFSKPLAGLNLVSKSYSANYARTNHNFIFQNLKSCSIASEPDAKAILNAVYVLKNMLQRGKPTIPSHRLRQALCNGDYSYHAENVQALISQKTVSWQRLIRGDIKTNHYPAKRFFDELIPKYFGEYAFIKQLTVPEVQIFDMTQVHVENFKNRQVDFYIAQVGLIIEIDGPQHEFSKEVDEDRDAFTSSQGLVTVRFSTDEIHNENQEFLNKVSLIVDHIRTVERLENAGVIQPPNGLTLQHYKNAFINGIDTCATNVRLTAAIRFQLLLLELIECGDIRLGKKTRILLINRDGIEFAREAADDLGDYLRELLVLMGLENLELQVEVNEVRDERMTYSMHDVKIDFSIFERFDDCFQTKLDKIFARTHYIDFYRSLPLGHAHSIESATLEDYDFFEVSCADNIQYDIDLSPDSKQRSALKYFLSNLFLPWVTDVDFREGQIGIIGSALSRKGTIGLLPTGSGKSICYQLSAILQPAISFVVCPIKSLMYDQKADLDLIGFTRCNFITGDLSPDQKARTQREYGRGKYFFVFISPERFQTQQFRKEMAAIGLDRSFAYAVIDEAHCLSEWGHDFRTSYLNLSNSINRLAPGACYIGLTATASVNVLRDIQNEFNIHDENVRTPLEFTRDELSFHVIDDLGQKAREAKSLVQHMESKWNSEANAKAGIIFTPTVNGDKGCFNLAADLTSFLNMEVNFFSGSAPDKYHSRDEEYDVYKRRIQSDFKANKYRLIVATKAFGMGVNKGNIAYTIHFGIPSSMEALYQEAGRAGRDKNLFKEVPADCYVLLTKEANTKALDNIWDISANVKDLKNNVNELSRQSDVKTNLFLMTVNLDTIKDEFDLVWRIYAFLITHPSIRQIEVAARNFGTEKSKFEKAIYRLSQIGIVTDWIIKDFITGVLLVDFTILEESQIYANVEHIIRKYDATFTLAELHSSESAFYATLNERLKNGKLDKIQYIFLVLLVWSYDHFVYNRRQSLKTVYEQCIELASGSISEADFKFRLEGYFKFNNSSHLLQQLAENTTNTSLWLSVFYDENTKDNVSALIDGNKLITLKEQLSRFLESYRDNACLNYISGIIRLATDQFDDSDGERRMSRALDRLTHRPIGDIEILIRETAKLKPLFSLENQCRFTKLFYEKFPNNHVLECINVEFGDPYTYQEILTPLVARLTAINIHFKGVAL